MKFQFKSIKAKLMTSFLLVALIPMACLSIISFIEVGKIAHAVPEEFEAEAHTVMDEVDMILASYWKNIKHYSEEESVRHLDTWYNKDDSVNHYSIAANKLVATNPYYLTAMVVDTQGRVVGTNTKDGYGARLSSEQLFKRNFANEDWFRESINAPRYSVYAEDAAPDELVNNTHDRDDAITNTFSCPVYNNNDEVIGVYHLRTSFRPIEKIFVKAYKYLKDHGYSTAELTLIDSKGRIIVDYDPTYNSGSLEPKRDFNNVLFKLNLAEKGVSSAVALVKGKSGNGDSYHARKKKDLVTGYVKSKGFEDFPGFKWGSMVRVEMDQAYAEVYLFQKMTYICVGIMTVLVLLCSVFISNQISRPISAIADLFKAVAKGDLTQTSKYKSKDELGQLASATNETIDNLNNIMFDLFKNSESLNRASQVLAETSNNVSAQSEQVTAQSSQVASAGEELSANVKGMTSRADELSASTNTIASSIEEMSATVNEVAKNCSEGSNIATRAEKRTGETLETMKELEKAASEIGGVVDFIKTIADQTNLLALNATIEAASAGEAGKGFAVVANEVKELASQSAKASDEISQKITHVQSQATNTMNAINDVAEIISDVTKLSNNIAAMVEEQSATINEISQTMGKFTHANEELAANCKEASLGTNEVSSNIQQINVAAGNSLENITKVSSNAQELAAMSTHLQEVVEQFKLDKAS